MEDGTPADQHMRKIAVHVSAYITHVRTQLKQTIPKAIVHCLVRHPVRGNVAMADGVSCCMLRMLLPIHACMAEQLLLCRAGAAGKEAAVGQAACGRGGR